MGAKNMVYLSSEQALADLASFRASMSATMGLDKRKWIVFGGSYPGNTGVACRKLKLYYIFYAQKSN